MILFNSIDNLTLNKLNFIVNNYCLNDNWREIYMNSSFKKYENTLISKINNTDNLDLLDFLILNIWIKGLETIDLKIFNYLKKNITENQNHTKYLLIIDSLVIYYNIDNNYVLTLFEEIKDARNLMNSFIKNLLEILNQNNYKYFYVYIDFLLQIIQNTNINLFYDSDWKTITNIIIKEIENDFKSDISLSLFELLSLLLINDFYDIDIKNNDFMLKRIKIIIEHVKDEKFYYLNNILDAL